MAQRLLSQSTAAEVLRSGGVLVLPTDTLPGLHGRADQPEALARIAALKGRDDDKPMLVLAASLDQVRELTTLLGTEREAFCRRCWPGPFSLILSARSGLPALITGSVVDQKDGTEQTTVAVRVPAPAFLRDLVTEVGAPLASTSVNRAGQPPLTDLLDAAGLFAEQIDGWWAPAEVDRAAGSPSALVDVTNWPPRLLRPGPQDMPK